MDSSNNPSNINLVLLKRPRCFHEKCTRKVQPIIGLCNYCEKKYCNFHRLPEEHLCVNIDKCRENSFKRKEYLQIPQLIYLGEKASRESDPVPWKGKKTSSNFELKQGALINSLFGNNQITRAKHYHQYLNPSSGPGPGPSNPQNLRK